MAKDHWKDDEGIIKAIALGNKLAFEQLYKRYSDHVFNISLSYTKRTQDAEEITQDVFVKIYKNASKFKGNSALGTWIYRIAVNSSLNFIKKKNQLKLNLDEHSEKAFDFEHPGVLMENKENAKILFSVIDKLKDNQKTAFILCFIEGLPQKEAADIMNLSVKALESLLQRAKQNLRKELIKIYPERRKR